MTRQYNVRIQLVFLFFLGIAGFFFNLQQAVSMTLVCVLFLGIQCVNKSLFYWLLGGGILYGLFFFFSHYVTIPALSFLNVFLFILIKMYPTLIVASSIAQVSTSKLMSALQSLHLPQTFITTLSILFRFFPVLKNENEMIQASTQMRGISYKHLKNWSHPLSLFEYAMVPLLMRTIHLADELSVNGYIRGMDSGVKRTSIHEDKLAPFDGSFLLIMIGVLAVLFIK
ncbi:energy-coupling factor transporter transmembrane component T [Vagococcus entomophilus]|uniref:Cobalt transporter n=1 Tax=Vagococcus entomophilus TaxID=1160095 RepID=A0A430AHB4_9ENTE|nr:energy-coupling factor transporter transmembrane component T [Vagococcus entomophilus]RSU07336.1 hypothetical protein CBF30_08795 [Vagococcus entomophilus]